MTLVEETRIVFSELVRRLRVIPVVALFHDTLVLPSSFVSVSETLNAVVKL